MQKEEEAARGRRKRMRKNVLENESLVLKSMENSSDVSVHIKKDPVVSIQQEW